MEYAVKVAKAGIADQSMTWSWHLLAQVNARLAGPEADFKYLNYMLDSDTDYTKPHKGMDYCYNWTQFGGYKEQVEGNMHVCRRIAQEVGGRIIDDEELRDTIPYLWEGWKGSYFHFGKNKSEIFLNNQSASVIFPFGPVDVWYYVGKPDDLVKLEKGFNQRIKEKHRVRSVPWYSRVFEYGIGGHLRYSVFADTADEKATERLATIRYDMNKWVFENYPYIHATPSPIQSYKHGTGMGYLLDTIKEALDPNHIMITASEERLESDDAGEDKVQDAVGEKGRKT